MPLDGPRPGLVWPLPADPSGEFGPRPSVVRGPFWRPVGAGLHVPAWVEQTTDQRIVEAACALPPTGGITGWASAHWAGGVWFPGRLLDGTQRPITLAIGSGDLGPFPGRVLSQERLGRSELITVDGLRHTTLPRAIVFEMRYAATVWEAVRILDMACFNDLVSIEEVRGLVGIMNGWTGIQRVRDALPLADENSWSPTETTTRLIWELLADLPRPLTNRPIFDLDGRFLGTPDLFDPVAGLAIDYDGQVHQSDRVRRRDRDRRLLFGAAGIETMTCMTGDAPQMVAEQMRAERRRALLRRTEGPPGWTLEPPPRWTSTLTVEQRRALPTDLAVRLLAHRRRRD